MKSILLSFFCLLIITSIEAQPANDSCSMAMNILIFNPASYCSLPAEFTNDLATSNATYGNATCWNGSGNDVWFVFTSPGAIDIEVKVIGGTMTQPEVAIFRGDCSGFAEFECATAGAGQNNVSAVPPTLDNNEIYYIRVSDNGSPGTFQLCIEDFVPFPQPGNDTCSNAFVIPTALPYCSAAQAFTTISSTPDTIGLPSCFTNANRDVWFTYTTGTVTGLTFTVRGNADGMAVYPLEEPEIAIYDGDCLTGLVEIACESAPLNQDSISLEAQGLLPNHTYYIRVNDYNVGINPQGGSFQLCATEIPAGFLVDEGGSSLCAGTLYDTGGPTGDYPPFEDHIFVICPTNPLSCIQFTLDTFSLNYFGPNPFANDRIRLHDGTSIADPLIATIENNGANQTFEALSGCITVDFRSRPFSNGGYGFEATWQCTNNCSALTPTANDSCFQAISVLGDGSYCSGVNEFSTINATPDSTAYGFPSCWSSSGRDTWFEFTADGISDFTISVSGNQGGNIESPQIAVYSGDCVGGFTELACAEDTGNNEISIDVLGLTNMQTYYIRVSDFETMGVVDGGTFQLCVGEYFPVISNGTTTECSGTLFDSGGPLNNYGPSEQFTYTICPTLPHTCIQIDVAFHEIEANFDFLRIYDGATTAGAQLAELTGNGTGLQYEAISGCVTLDFSSDNFVERPGFELSWNCTNTGCNVAANDECSQAIVVAGDGTYCSGTGFFSTLLATETMGLGSPSCWTGTDNDVWFEFTPSNGVTDFVISIEGSINNPQLALLSGDCSTGFVELECDAGTGSTAEIETAGLAIGTTYYLRVNFQSGEGNFELCVEEDFPAIDNDVDNNCSGTLYDTGGPNNDYGGNEQFEYLICPTDPHGCIRLDIVSYELEAGFDFLTIYNGNSSTGTQVAQFSGTGTNELVEVQTTGCVGVIFTSDAFVQQDGFELTWTCTAQPCIIGIGQNNDQKEITLFPNPTEDQLIVSIDQLSEDVTVNIVNMLGVVVYSEQHQFVNQLSLSTSHLASGNYIVQVVGQTTVVSSPFVKK